MVHVGGAAFPCAERNEQTADGKCVSRLGTYLRLLYDGHMAPVQRRVSRRAALYTGSSYRFDVMMSAAVAEAGRAPKD